MIGTVPQIRIPIVLGLLEVVERLVVAPAWIPHCLPLLVIVSIAPYVQHVVKDARAAEYFASGPVASPAIHRQAGPAIRLRLVLPVELG